MIFDQTYITAFHSLSSDCHSVFDTYEHVPLLTTAVRIPCSNCSTLHFIIHVKHMHTDDDKNMTFYCD